MKIVVIVSDSTDHKYFCRLTHFCLRRKLIVHRGENPVAWDLRDRFVLDKEIMMWSSITQNWVEKNNPHRESCTLKRWSVSLEAVLVAFEPLVLPVYKFLIFGSALFSESSCPQISSGSSPHCLVRSRFARLSYITNNEKDYCSFLSHAFRRLFW